MFTVYVLKNVGGKIYIGQTQDLVKRLGEHNNRPRIGYKDNERPFTVVYHEIFSTRTEAMRREKALKSGKGREWLKNILRE